MASLAVHAVDGLIIIPPSARPAPRLVRALVVAHERVTPLHWHMSLRAPEIAASALPGQFLMVTVGPGGEAPQALPRPMAISRVDGENIEFIYGVVGAGTERLAHTAIGDRVSIVGPLGQPFTRQAGTRRLLVIGRGIGSCSLTMLVDRAVAGGIEVTAVDSARTADMLVGVRYFREFGARELCVNDADGTSAVAVLETTLREHFAHSGPPDQIAVCGSVRLTELARQIGREWDARVEVSIEAHMACGIGYCHGCSRGTRSATAEAPLVCKDGPVFQLDPSPTRGES